MSKKFLYTTKSLFTASSKLMLIGLILWIVETIFFLFLEGWHLKATNLIEKKLDVFSMLLIQVGFGIAFLAVIRVTTFVNNALIEESENEENK